MILKKDHSGFFLAFIAFIKLLFKEMWLYFFITTLVYMRSSILEMTVSNRLDGVIFKNIFKELMIIQIACYLFKLKL